MKAPGAVTVPCPACDDRLDVPYTVRTQGASMVLAIDSEPVMTHVRGHLASVATITGDGSGVALPPIPDECYPPDATPLPPPVYGP